MQYQDWVKMSCHLESKSSCTFNFIGIFALKIVQQQQKMTQYVTSQTKRKKIWEKTIQLDTMTYM